MQNTSFTFKVSVTQNKLRTWKALSEIIKKKEKDAFRNEIRAVCITFGVYYIAVKTIVDKCSSGSVSDLGGPCRTARVNYFNNVKTLYYEQSRNTSSTRN